LDGGTVSAGAPSQISNYRVPEYDAPDPKTVDGIADMGFAWAAWIVDPNRNVLGIIEPKR